MSLDNYAAVARTLAQELATTLDAADLAALREDLATIDLHTWLTWRDRHVELVAAFVSATPSVRSKRAAWRRDRLRLTWAGYQHCMEAADLLDAVQDLAPGGSYRAMAAQAGLAAQRLQDADWPCWPWDDPWPWDE